MWEEAPESQPAEEPFMSDPVVSAFLLQQLCAHGGRLAVSEVPRHLCLPPAHIASILREEASRFLLLEQAGVVLALSAVRLCNNYLREQCEAADCEHLHLCRFFILGRCFHRSKGNSCSFSHNIQSEVNKAVLKAHKISSMDEKDLQVLLLLNDPSLLPEVCKEYKGERKVGSCTSGAQCNRLHICGYFARGQCHYANCSRSHNLLDPNHTRLLQARGLSKEMCQNIHLMRTHQCNEAQREFRKNNTKDNCAQMHYYLPYRWQILEGTGEWKDLSSMEEIEKAYSDPNNASSKLHNIDFQTMTSSSLTHVRRLSTTSSVTKSRDYVLTTKWIWYWKDESGQWTEYGKYGGTEKHTVTSEDLENIYLADKKFVLTFEAGSQKYEINFKDMTQRNLLYGTKRAVLRRPRFVSQEEVKTLKRGGKTSQVTSASLSTPDYWDTSALPSTDQQLVAVQRCSLEFQEIEGEFAKTMSGFSVQHIKRIQNPSLWQAYQMKRKTMKTLSRDRERDVLEKKLFHGTNDGDVATICRENFDWRNLGLIGSIYGKGSYFSRDASYSHQYCQSISSKMSMFLARVLVGDFVKGHSSYLRPPAKPTNLREAYDSCVDIEHDPSIYVIFDKHQIYPEYVLEYIEIKTNIPAKVPGKMLNNAHEDARAKVPDKMQNNASKKAAHMEKEKKCTIS